MKGLTPNRGNQQKSIGMMSLPPLSSLSITQYVHRYMSVIVLSHHPTSTISLSVLSDPVSRMFKHGLVL